MACTWPFSWRLRTPGSNSHSFLYIDTTRIQPSNLIWLSSLVKLVFGIQCKYIDKHHDASLFYMLELSWHRYIFQVPTYRVERPLGSLREPSWHGFPGLSLTFAIGNVFGREARFLHPPITLWAFFCLPVEISDASFWCQQDSILSDKLKRGGHHGNISSLWWPEWTMAGTHWLDIASLILYVLTSLSRVMTPESFYLISTAHGEIWVFNFIFRLKIFSDIWMWW